jgi:uncharacterized protein
MITRLSLLVVVMPLSFFTACADHRPGPDDVLTDRSTATEELLLNAERGTAEDQYNLGVHYERGDGISQSYQEAIRWYRRSAMQGYPDAQYKLCEMSERGQGLPQDYQEALRWCGLAAEHSHGRAMFMLGRLYHTGHGVPEDVVRAHMWYNLATANGYGEGKKWRDRLADDMSPTQIAEAQKLAREWNLRLNSRNS